MITLTLSHSNPSSSPVTLSRAHASCTLERAFCGLFVSHHIHSFDYVRDDEAAFWPGLRKHCGVVLRSSGTGHDDDVIGCGSRTGKTDCVCVCPCKLFKVCAKSSTSLYRQWVTGRGRAIVAQTGGGFAGFRWFDEPLQIQFEL